MVLLGIHAALKEDPQDRCCTAAELVYAVTLSLRPKFFDSSRSKDFDPVSYVRKLKAIMQQLWATPPRGHFQHKAYVSKDLARCKHVFLQHDATQAPLQPPYNCLFIH